VIWNSRVVHHQGLIKESRYYAATTLINSRMTMRYGSDDDVTKSSISNKLGFVRNGLRSSLRSRENRRKKCGI